MEEILARIKKFDLDDFHGTAPYEYLYQFNGNSFEREQAKEALIKRAKDVGYKKFASVYKKYVEAQKETDVPDADEYSGNYTEFPDQPLELCCGDWVATNEGVYRLDRNGMREYACHHPIIVTLQLTDIETGETRIEVQYRIPRVDTEWKSLVVDTSVISSARNIVTLSKWGIDVTSSTATTLVNYIQDLRNLNHEDITVKQSISRLGYYKNIGFAPYVPDLVFGASNEYRKLYDSIAQVGTYDAWLETALYCRTQSVASRIMLAASFASPLISVLHILSFFVHIWGPSGTGKSVSLALAASVWGNPDHDKYMMSYNATAVALERTAAFLCDLPCCLDELQLSRDKNIQNIVYLLTQTTGRSRGRKEGGVESALFWRNINLSTGESPIASVTSGSGTVNRVIDIACPTDQPLLSNPSQVMHSILSNYGHAGKMFVESLYSSPFEQDCVHYWYDDFLNQLQESGATGKQCMAAAAVLTADAMATQLLFKDNLSLTVEDILPYLATSTDISVGAAAYEYICNWVSINRQHFLPSENAYADVYGIIKNGYAYINSVVFDDVMRSAGFDRSTVLAYLKQHDLLHARKDNKGYSVSVRIDGEYANCICIKLNVSSDSEEV